MAKKSKPRRKRETRRSGLQTVAAALHTPTPLGLELHRARQQVNDQRTRLAVVSQDKRYRGIDGTDYDKMIKDMKSQIDQTWGEAMGTRLPIERGMYP